MSFELQQRMDAERGEIVSMYRPHKYGAKACTVDGQRFASRKEAGRYVELRLLERGGRISDLQTQVRYPLEVNGILITHYVADFKYFDKDKREWVVEDSKGFQTDVFKLKQKLVRACYGLEILIT
jgi:hypothetical protein